MNRLPDHVHPYKKTKLFTQDTIPEALMNDHQTKAGTWGVIHIQRGTLKYTIGADEVHLLTADSPPGVVTPEQRHRVQPVGEVAFFVEFH